MKTILFIDFKASNVLLDGGARAKQYDPIVHGIQSVHVVDFECSVGVVGTGYWRAPEILQGVQNRDIKPHLFTKKSDVYSFAMTCYEVITGLIPFEDLDNSYNDVIEGLRPKLPDSIDPCWKTLLSRCWHADPSKRPSFEEILRCLKKIYPHDYIPNRYLSLRGRMASFLCTFRGN